MCPILQKKTYMDFLATPLFIIQILYIWKEAQKGKLT